MIEISDGLESSSIVILGTVGTVMAKAVID